MCSTTAHSTTENNPIKTLGIHHLGLSVPNIQETAEFFIEYLGFKQVGEKPDYPAIFISNGTIMLTLWKIKNQENMNIFDRQSNVGLHHFALNVINLETLQNLYQTLSQLDNVDIEFAPEALVGLPFHHMMCFIPGGIRLELICE